MTRGGVDDDDHPRIDPTRDSRAQARAVSTWASALAAGDPWVRWDWVTSHGDEIMSALREHLVLTIEAVLLGLIVAVPISLVAVRYRWLQAPAFSIAGILYTIPSLALFAILVPLTGLSRTTALIPLASYTLFILTRNIVTGLEGVPSAVKDAADGMGYGRTARLVKVELPLALPSIMAGIRLATISTIGLVTVTALIGLGGLGQLINDGLNRDFRTPLVVGTVLSVAMAIAADLLLVGVQKLATPWARAGR
jgi:osmoprotectant transport system permease protein